MDKILRLATPGGKPIVVDAMRKPIVVTIQDGEKSHKFQFSQVVADGIATKEGSKLTLDADEVQRLRTFLSELSGSAVPVLPEGTLEVSYLWTRAIFDGDTVTIIRKPPLSKSNEKIISVSQISSVQFKESGFTAGYIQFVFSGSSEHKGPGYDVYADENTVAFKGKELTPQFRAFKDAIMKRVVDMKSPKPAPSALQPTSIDELEKLARLRDRGIVTEEEFTAKKKQLLGL